MERQSLDLLVAEIVTEPMALERDRKTVALLELVQERRAAGDSLSISDAAIDQLARLVSDPSTSLAACSTLAELAPRSRRAVPAVSAAIERMELAEQQANSGTEARLWTNTVTIGRLRSCLQRIVSH
jgi:hypothetical protein